MPLAIPYIRFSTKEQLSGSSLARQEKAVADWLSKNPDYQLSPTRYEDLGVSGTGDHVEKGRLGALIDAVSKGMVPPGSVILVEAIDRFTRLEPLDAVGPLKTIVKAGIALVDLEVGVRYDQESLKGDTLLMFLFRAKAAYEYSSRLAGRIAASYEDRAKLAKAGQTIKRKHGFWLTSEGKLIAGKVDIVRDVFRSFLNGEPVRSITKRHGDTFKTPASCKKLLRNPAVIGHWQRVKVEKVGSKRKVIEGELIKKVFDAAIKDADYYQAQELLEQTASPGFTNARKFFFAGLVRCSECNAKMLLVRAGPNTKTDRVRCPSRNNGEHSCTNGMTIPTPVLAYFFLMTHLIYVYKGFQASRLPELARRRIEVQGRLDAAEKAVVGTEALFLVNPDDIGLRERYSLRVQERNELKAELDGMQEAPDAANLDYATLSSAGFAHAIHGIADPLMQEFLAFHESLDKSSLNRILQLGGYSIGVHPDGTMIVPDPSLYNSMKTRNYGSIRYLGYERKTKTFKVAHGDQVIWVNDAGIQVRVNIAPSPSPDDHL
ncbi:recombinase family protein [Pseudomonas citronellolis]|uniref:recombinase family protein n=1 Tax=Pseudomonas citronellolis TaxID=53408 RepID=UPI0022BA3318|nr:recombinase family protein [Pseudomonas citronellolis]WBG62192.1 recombinase family protein [Pseudomonas citronellolis]